MTGKEHLKFSIYSVCLIQAGLHAKFTLTTEQSTLFMAGGLLGAVLPDTDTKESIAAAILPFYEAHKTTEIKFLGHGGITHTLLFNGLIVYAGYNIESFGVKWLVYGIAFGFFTHLMGDHITGNKLKYLYFPIPQIIKFVKWLYKKLFKKRKRRR